MVSQHSTAGVSGPIDCSKMAISGQAAPERQHSIASFDDDFMMHRFKVEPCRVSRPHIWRNCPFVHCGEPVRRRHPSLHHPELCASVATKGAVCDDGPDRCRWAHNSFEAYLHPARYKTIMCRKGRNCTRSVCFFAHSPAELRLPSSPKPPPRQQQQQQQLPSLAHVAPLGAAPLGVAQLLAAPLQQQLGSPPDAAASSSAHQRVMVSAALQLQLAPDLLNDVHTTCSMLAAPAGLQSGTPPQSAGATAAVAAAAAVRATGGSLLSTALDTAGMLGGMPGSSSSGGMLLLDGGASVAPAPLLPSPWAPSPVPSDSYQQPAGAVLPGAGASPSSGLGGLASGGHMSPAGSSMVLLPAASEALVPLMAGVSERPLALPASAGIVVIDAPSFHQPVPVVHAGASSNSSSGVSWDVLLQAAPADPILQLVPGQVQLQQGQVQAQQQLLDQLLLLQQQQQQYDEQQLEQEQQVRQQLQREARQLQQQERWQQAVSIHSQLHEQHVQLQLQLMLQQEQDGSQQTGSSSSAAADGRQGPQLPLVPPPRRTMAAFSSSESARMAAAAAGFMPRNAAAEPAQQERQAKPPQQQQQQGRGQQQGQGNGSVDAVSTQWSNSQQLLAAAMDELSLWDDGELQSSAAQTSQQEPAAC